MKKMDHWERIQACIAGEALDHPPVSLWRHFPEEDLHMDKLVFRTLEWQRKWDFDLVKYSPSGTYSAEAWGAFSQYLGISIGARSIIEAAIRKPADWDEIKPVSTRIGPIARQNEALAHIARNLRGQAPLLMTIFSPLTTAFKMAGERLYADLRLVPDKVERALQAITQTTIDTIHDSLAAGAHGIFFATQQASNRVLSVPEFERFGKAFDLQILEAVKDKLRVSMLHAHGHDIMVDSLADYPVDMINWHDRETQPSLQEAMGLFAGKALVGGISEMQVMMQGSQDDIRREVQDAIDQTGGRRLMLAPGCVLHIKTTDAAIQTVIDTVRGHNSAG